MVINGKNYLLLERRGCEYCGNDKGKDDINNYRVGSYDYSITGKDGRNYIIEFGSRDAVNWRTTNKRTGKPLKKAVCEMVLNNALRIDTQYDEDKDGSGFISSWRNLKMEQEFYKALPVPYCQQSILNFVNSISAEHYDAIKWVYTFETTRPAAANWTPAGLIHELASRYHLEERQPYGTLEIKAGRDWWKFLCYQIEAGNKALAKVTVYLEKVTA